MRIKYEDMGVKGREESEEGRGCRVESMCGKKNVVS